MWRLDLQTYGGGVAKEMRLSRRVMQPGKWLQIAALLHAAGFALGLHRQDETLLSLLLLAAAALTFAKLHFKVKEESVLIVRALGIRVTTKYASGWTSSSFYDATRVKDVVINEGFTMHRILFYLTILLQDPQQPGRVAGLVPLFLNSVPRLGVLKVMYNEAASVLHSCICRSYDHAGHEEISCEKSSKLETS